MENIKTVNDKIEIILNSIKNTDDNLTELEKLITTLQNYLKTKIIESVKIKKNSQINEDGFKEWLNHYWTWGKTSVCWSVKELMDEFALLRAQYVHRKIKLILIHCSILVSFYDFQRIVQLGGWVLS